MTEAEEIGERIRLAMKSKGINNLQLARRVEVHHTTVSAWRTGKQRPDDESLAKVANILGVSLSGLRYGDSVPTIRTTDTASAWGTAFREGRRSVLRELRAWLETEEKRLGPEP